MFDQLKNGPLPRSVTRLSRADPDRRANHKLSKVNVSPSSSTGGIPNESIVPWDEVVAQGVYVCALRLLIHFDFHGKKIPTRIPHRGSGRTVTIQPSESQFNAKGDVISDSSRPGS